MEQKRARYFTLMIMPETSGMEVKRMRLSRRVIQGGIATLVLMVLATAGAVTHSSYMWGQGDENQVLRDQNATLRLELEHLDDRVRELDEVVGQLRRLDAKLRQLTMVSDPARNLAIGPVGAPEERNHGPAAKSAAALRRDLLRGRDGGAVDLVKGAISTSARDAAETLDEARDLSIFLEGQKAMLSSTPSRRPTHGYITSTYGMRIDPFTGLPQRHAGLDFSASIGSPVTVTADGTVIFAGKKGAYGNTIEVDHGQGLVTKYAHLSRVDVRVGERVQRGSKIGEVGNTGRSTGPHLHYEVRLSGIPQNPQRFLLE